MYTWLIVIFIRKRHYYDEKQMVHYYAIAQSEKMKKESKCPKPLPPNKYTYVPGVNIDRDNLLTAPLNGYKQDDGPLRQNLGRCFMHVPERIFALSTRKKGKERKREKREKRKRKGKEIVIHLKRCNTHIVSIFINY